MQTVNGMGHGGRVTSEQLWGGEKRTRVVHRVDRNPGEPGLENDQELREVSSRTAAEVVSQEWSD